MGLPCSRPADSHHSAPAARRPLVAMLYLLAGSLTQLGCHGNQQAYKDLYHRELRLQEDEIYRLEDCIEEYQGLIRGYRQEVEQLKEQLGEPSTVAPRPSEADQPAERSLLDNPRKARPIAPDADPPNGAERSPLPADTPPLEGPPVDIPEIDLGEPAEAPTPPPIDVPGLSPAEPEDTTDRYGPGEALPLPADGPLSDAPLGEAPVWQGEQPTAAALPSLPLGNAKLEGYVGPSLETGETTLVTLVTPIDQSDRPTRFVGQASVLLIDPTLPAASDKLARWDFSAEEVGASWRAGAPQPTLDLAIVLPDDAPRDRILELWVRLIDEHDAKVLARAEMVVDRMAQLDLSEPPLVVSEVPSPVSEPVAAAIDSGWQSSDHRATATPTAQLGDSSWKASDRAPLREPRKIQLAAHEEMAELAPLPVASEAPNVPEWSPKRLGQRPSESRRNR